MTEFLGGFRGIETDFKPFKNWMYPWNSMACHQLIQIIPWVRSIRGKYPMFGPISAGKIHNIKSIEPAVLNQSNPYSLCQTNPNRFASVYLLHQHRPLHGSQSFFHRNLVGCLNHFQPEISDTNWSYSTFDWLNMIKQSETSPWKWTPSCLITEQHVATLTLRFDWLKTVETYPHARWCWNIYQHWP